MAEKEKVLSKSTDVPAVKHFFPGMLVTYGREQAAKGYGTIVSVDKETGVIKVTDVNGISGKEDEWSIGNIFAMA